MDDLYRDYLQTIKAQGELARRLTTANEQLQAENARLRAIVAPLIAAGKQATPGPWRAADGNPYRDDPEAYDGPEMVIDPDVMFTFGGMQPSDAEFCATARAVADALAAEQAELVERLR